MNDDTIWTRPPVTAASALILRSYERVVGRALLPASGDPAEDARALFEAPFAVLAHGAQDDPVLFYGNALALRLWSMSFEEFTRMPSRLTAEPMLREERQRLLAAAARKGFIDDYTGVRIASDGRRFMIRDVTLWTLTDGDGAGRGQAARVPVWGSV